MIAERGRVRASSMRLLAHSKQSSHGEYAAFCQAQWYACLMHCATDIDMQCLQCSLCRDRAHESREYAQDQVMVRT